MGGTLVSGQVLAAIISTGGAILIAVITQAVTVWKLRRENKTQHDDNRQAVDRLGGKVDLMHDDVRHVADRLDEHMRNHAPTIQPTVINHPRHHTSGNSDVA